MAKYMLLRGAHRAPNRTFRSGNVIDSDVDLPVKFGRDKFLSLSDYAVEQQRLLDVAAAEAARRENLDNIPDSELRRLSQAAELPFGNNVSRGDLIKLMKKAGVTSTQKDKPKKK